jgi:hypothetical protein
MATAAILNFFQLPQKLPHTMVDIPTKFHDSDFFLAYLVPLDVYVVPIKFHQFLFGE